jgi:Sulfate permease family
MHLAPRQGNSPMTDAAGAGSTESRRRLPGWLFSSLVPYRRSWLGRDVVAGLTVWAVLVPESLAYASIAGVSPAVDLYAAPSALLSVTT